MTNEEASFILANIDRRVCDDELNDALDVAIKALEAQPCEDCVSRQASLRKGKWLEGHHYYPHFCSNCNYYTNDWDEMNFCPKCGSDMREE